MYSHTKVTVLTDQPPEPQYHFDLVNVGDAFMIKVEVVHAQKIVQPPDEVVIRMPMAMARELRTLLMQIGVGGPDMRIYGPTCPHIPDDERKADTLYDGHHWKYKRVTDVLESALASKGIPLDSTIVAE